MAAARFTEKSPVRNERGSQMKAIPIGPDQIRFRPETTADIADRLIQLIQDKQ